MCRTILIHQFTLLPLDRTKPPRVKSSNNENIPKVLAIIIFLPAAPINVNRADATWFIITSIKNCLKNLQQKS